jgi:hypothetical protein
MIKMFSKRRRRGVTLVELASSTIAAAALLTGISSSVYIALRASNPNLTPGPAVVEATACASDICGELQYALAVTEATASAITFTAPDYVGDGDTANETIRYAWAGANQPLTRRFNGGTTANAIGSVYSLSLTYYPSSAAPELVTLRIQPRSDSQTVCETTIPLLNL